MKESRSRYHNGCQVAKPHVSSPGAHCSLLLDGHSFPNLLLVTEASLQMESWANHRANPRKAELLWLRGPQALSHPPSLPSLPKWSLRCLLRMWSSVKCSYVPPGYVISRVFHSSGLCSKVDHLSQGLYKDLCTGEGDSWKHYGAE